MMETATPVYDVGHDGKAAKLLQQQEHQQQDEHFYIGEVDLEKWYSDCGILQRSSFVNAEGLRLQTYHWLPQQQQPPYSCARGKIVLVHGYGVHARFDYLRHEPSHIKDPPHLKNSWVEKFLSLGLSVHTLDLQSFGESEGLRGKRAHFSEIDVLPRDVIQFMHEQVLPAAGNPDLPIFLCGGSMGGFTVVRVLELLGGGHMHVSHPLKPVAAAVHVTGGEAVGASSRGEAGSATGDAAAAEVSKEWQHHHKQALPLKGVIALAPMISLEHLKKKNKFVLPFRKMLACVAPTLEVGKPAKNERYPVFDEIMHNDPLCFVGKSRARLSSELLDGCTYVQEDVRYIAFPDASAKCASSPLPLPVYVPQTPALLVVASKFDGFVDTEGSVFLAASLEAKIDGNIETITKYQSVLDVVAKSGRREHHPDATLWLLDDMYHALTKELPEADALLERLCQNWLVPHLDSSNSIIGAPVAPPMVEEVTAKKEAREKKNATKSDEKCPQQESKIENSEQQGITNEKARQIDTTDEKFQQQAAAPDSPARTSKPIVKVDGDEDVAPKEHKSQSKLPDATDSSGKSADSQTILRNPPQSDADVCLPATKLEETVH